MIPRLRPMIPHLRSIRLTAVLMLAAIVAACGPMYDTQYFYTPPSDSAGRQLAGQCRVMSRMCAQNCELRESACRSEARDDARYEYNRYVKQRQKENAKIKKSLDSFVRDSHCSSSSCENACDAEYRSCYTEAGGQVRSKQVCVAFCDEKK